MWSHPATPTLVILGALLAQRVAEMALSSRHLRAARDAGGEPVAVAGTESPEGESDHAMNSSARARPEGAMISIARARPEGAMISIARARPEGALYAVHTLFFVLPLIESAARGGAAPFHVPAMLWWAGVAALIGAQAVRLATMRALGVMWRIPALAFTTDHIVTDGPYTHVRHPNHAVVLIEFAVVPLLCGAPLAWLCLNVVHTPLVLARVRTEERALARLGPYAQLMEGRRAFLPCFPKRSAAKAAPSR